MTSVPGIQDIQTTSTYLNKHRCYTELHERKAKSYFKWLLEFHFGAINTITNMSRFDSIPDEGNSNSVTRKEMNTFMQIAQNFFVNNIYSNNLFRRNLNKIRCFQYKLSC